MAKPGETATMADINDPAPKQPEPRTGLPPERRTVAPTPQRPGMETQGGNGGKDDDDMAGMAKKAAADHASAAKDAAATRAREEAERVREAGESFEEGSFAHAASERLADNLSHAAESIRDTDFNHLARDVATFARKQPLLFFGGAALLGFAAGRMLKASERAEHHYEDRYDYTGRGV